MATSIKRNAKNGSHERENDPQKKYMRDLKSMITELGKKIKIILIGGEHKHTERINGSKKMEPNHG